MTFKNQVFSGVKWTTAGTIVTTIAALIKISVLTRFLDAEDFGLMAMVTFIIGFMNLFNDMGLTSAILHKQSISKEEYGSLYWLNLIISIIVFALLCFLTPLISSFYNHTELIVLIPLLGTSLLISGIGNMFKTMEQKNLRFKSITTIEIFAATISLVFSIILALNDYGIYALVISALIQYSVKNVLYLILGLSKHGILFHFKLSDTKPFLKIGSYQVGGQVINFFNRDLDILIIGKMFSPEILGGYSLAKQLVMRPMQILNPILSKVASPTLAKFQDNLQGLRRNYLALINVISSLNIPVYLLLMVFAPWVVELLYGNEFENIVILVRILSVYMMVKAICNPIGSLVIATGRTDVEFYWNIFSILITPICIYIGAQYGIVGAAIGITTSIILLFIPGWRFLIYKLTKASLPEYSKAIFVIRIKMLISRLS